MPPWLGHLCPHDDYDRNIIYAWSKDGKRGVVLRSFPTAKGKKTTVEELKRFLKRTKIVQSIRNTANTKSCPPKT